MSEENKFKDSLNDLFEGYKVPLPTDGWERLEASLEAAQKARLTRQKWYIGTAAAVAAMLIGAILLIYTPSTTSELLELANKEAITSEPSIKEIAIKKTGDLIAEVQPGLSKKPDRRSKEAVGEAIFAEQAKVTRTEASEIAEELIKGDLKSHQIPSHKKEEKQSETAVEKEKMLSQDEIDRLIAEFAKAGNIDLFDLEDYSKKDSPIMLAFNSGGAIRGAKSETNSPAVLRSTSVEDVDQLTYSWTKNTLSLSGDTPPIVTQNIATNEAKLHHSQPVSFGITVSKNIVDRLDVETGLIYTFLHSSTRNKSSQFMRKERQHLHYLGVPLNFNYYFITLGNFDFFATVGGKIEKDIYGKYYRESMAQDGENYAEERESESIKLKNPQLSVNGGFGITYPLYKGLNIYGKLAGAYYFDAKNPQYKTIYSDKQFIMDLNVGLRINF